MQVYWSEEFDRQLTQFEELASRSTRDQTLLDLLAAMLPKLRAVPKAPISDTAMLKRVRQSGRHLVWRQSHPFASGIALRLICWFPEDSDIVVELCSPETKRRWVMSPTIPSAVALTK